MTSKLFSLNAEEALLSILLANPDAIFEENNLVIEMFSSVPSQTLYAIIEELANTGLSPSLDLIKASLLSKGNYEAIGGDSYLDWLMSKDNNADNFYGYEELVVASYKARKMLELSSSIKGMIGNNISEINSVITSVQNRLDSISITTNKESASRLSESLRSAYETIKARIENPGLSGLDTGYKSINYITGGHSKGDLWVVAARPSIGKTALILNTLLKTSAPVDGGHKSLFFSLEMPKQTVIDRLLAIDSGNRLTDIRLGNLNIDSQKRINESLVKFKENNLFIDCNFHTSPSYIVDIIKKYYKQEKIDAVYIDYIQLAVERDAESVNSIGRMTRAMKKIAKDLDIAVGIVSQLNRACELRDNKRPILSDLRASGNIEEDADMVAFLYRDDYYYADSNKKGLMEFIVRKNRNGAIGTIMLKFNAETNKIEDAK